MSRYDKDGKFVDMVIRWVVNNLRPENVFSREHLERWAVDNGFIKAVGL